MAELNKNDVWVGAPEQKTTGPILSAEVQKSAPSGVDDALSGFESAGWVSEDGLSVKTTKGYEEIRDWSAQVVRKLLKEFSGEISWSHISMDVESWKNYVGPDNVAVTATADGSHGKQVTIKFNAGETPRRSWAFKIKDGKRRALIYVPDGQAGGEGELKFKAAEAITLPITLTTFPDSDGNHIYIYTDDGVTTD